MRLAVRAARLEALVPRRRPGIAADPMEFIHGLAAGRFTANDIDRINPELSSGFARHERAHSYCACNARSPD